MDRLLNVREAAELIKVSQMTIRRWTNAGILRCYRIGPKKQRRFRLRDLEEYLLGMATPQGRAGISLGFQDLKVSDGTHAAHLYRSDEEAMAVAVSYMEEGLRNGETVMVVAPEARCRLLLDRLGNRGMDAIELQRIRRLHLSHGTAIPSEHAALISNVMSGSPSRFRLVGEMLWTRKKGWSAEQIESLERMSNLGMCVSGRLFLCQYDLREFSGNEAMMALETHRQVLYKGMVQESHYFMQV
jgi:excisionase family DNA binding protein